MHIVLVSREVHCAGGGHDVADIERERRRVKATVEQSHYIASRAAPAAGFNAPAKLRACIMWVYAWRRWIVTVEKCKLAAAAATR